MKVTTKTGDGGYTGLPSGVRVPKNDPRVACLGAVDELDAVLAGALLAGPSPRGAETITAVREELFSVILPAIADIPSRPADVACLERNIAELEALLHRDGGFVRAWTRQASAALNIARTICRRAEREAVTLSRPGDAPVLSSSAGENGGGVEGARSPGGETPENGGVVVYLNRLSDLLFLLAVNEETDKADG
jgi:cob(I)alamin adenosyltransferase